MKPIKIESGYHYCKANDTRMEYFERVISSMSIGDSFESSLSNKYEIMSAAESVGVNIQMENTSKGLGRFYRLHNNDSDIVSCPWVPSIAFEKKEIDYLICDTKDRLQHSVRVSGEYDLKDNGIYKILMTALNLGVALDIKYNPKSSADEIKIEFAKQ